MKKSIVLLISLLFITAISALLLQNLDDTQSYVESQNYKINKVQLMALVKNAQIEAMEVIKKHPEEIEKGFENIPLKIEDNELLFTLKEYDKKNINLLRSENREDYKIIEDWFFDKELSNFENLLYIVSQGEETENNKQLDAIMNKFIKDTYDDKILEFRNDLGFLAPTQNGDKLYELYLKIKNLNDFINAYYVLDKNGGVKYFELGFK